VRSSPYAGSTIALATVHNKESAIAPVFDDLLGADVVVIAIDTDRFGTFTGEIPRLDTPLEAAIAKARAGMDCAGYTVGLASEGTIGPDPVMPFVTSDIEMIVLVDDIRGITVSEMTRSTDIVAVREAVTPKTDLKTLLARADFPRHGLIVRTAEPKEGPIFKGITDHRTLASAISACSATNGTAIVESDLRACFSPSRMRNIRDCAIRLAQRLDTPCPECTAPGWGAIEPVRGLPCSACGTFVESAIRADAFGCPACSARHEVPRPNRTVDPRWCPLCNP